MNPLALTSDEFMRLFRQRYGRGLGSAAWYRYVCEPSAASAVAARGQALNGTASAFPSALLKGHATFGGEPFNGVLARQVAEDFRIELPRIVARQDQDGITKLVLGLDDGFEIETVILPMPRHVTVCISSQVGCRMACRFCQTGRMGLRRQLRTAEIVAQVYLVQAVLGLAVRNVVFMGMGEPLDNWEPVMQAVRVLNDQRGINIGLRRITLSTIGLVPALERLAALKWPQLGIALSLNAAADGLRHHLMPATIPFTLEQLKRTLQAYPLAKGRVFFIAYVLIRDVNDSEDHALRVASLLEGLPVKVNLIACNPGEESNYQAPPLERIERFRRILVDQHYFVRLRGVKGGHIQAACGQLGRGSRCGR